MLKTSEVPTARLSRARRVEADPDPIVFMVISLGMLTSLVVRAG
jgi:hypothetical protein